MLKWFDTKPSEAFATELAAFLLEELRSRTAEKNAGKFEVKAQRTLNKAIAKVHAFKSANKLNFYKRAKLGNALLWALKDGGCSEKYATELTEWVTVRL
jgi:hypothetical protein